MTEKIERLGGYFVQGFHLFALFVIGGTVVWSAAHFYIVEIMQQGHAKLHDILLLFIYLEIGAMVGIYFRTRRLPVRFLIYVAITALTRVLVIDSEQLAETRVLTLTGAIVILALAALAIDFSAARFRPADQDA
ncbi:MAG TPA: phosphate-starvation-inducible PsiE family protein [Burkholderiales bacterium]|jgi:phosphate starvation-inducible membrane PsiE|nr:phosphate-starvation-inducible PsiE family protein [Burkholderiales bacterium]